LDLAQEEASVLERIIYAIRKSKEKEVAYIRTRGVVADLVCGVPGEYSVGINDLALQV